MRKLAAIVGGGFDDDVDEFKALFVSGLIVGGVIDLDQRDGCAQALENDARVPFARLLHIAEIGQPAFGIHTQQPELGAVEFHRFEVVEQLLAFARVEIGHGQSLIEYRCEICDNCICPGGKSQRRFMATFSVQEVTKYIHELFDADSVLSDARVRGEVSNLTRAASGHWYFSIKDAKAQLRCVMFRGRAQYVRLDVKAGDEIIVRGRISVYDARGEYQLYAESIEAVGGIGDLHAQFEALKAKLDAEGLFDADRKREIPVFPRRIGIVTSPTAAAYQDMLNVFRRRFPMLEIILSPTLVQGAEAPQQIVAALRRLEDIEALDVVIVARGGGSLEDLWCFNDEAVARAIAACGVPVISGIGHEIDFTIADFVADLRAPTPSAAAEVATPNRDDLLLDLDRMDQTVNGAFGGILRQKQLELRQAQQRLGYVSPARTIEGMGEKLASQRHLLRGSAFGRLEKLGDRLLARSRLLDAADPRRILGRGYAIVSDEAGTVVRSAREVHVNQRLGVRFHEDQIKVRVEN